jgi:putative ABC transport system permease protein
VPLYKGMLKARLASGEFQTCNVLGLDDVSLVGGPPEMVEGRLADLRRTDAVIIDQVGATTKLATTDPATGRRIPVRIGDTLELNDHRAVVVGICKVSRTFQSQPVVYTTYSRATTFAPRERKLLGFVLVKARPGVDQQTLCARITAETGLGAHTSDGFKWMTIVYFMKFTGIPINIGIGVILALVVGTAISGQTFYAFTIDNLRYLGALKAMGAGNGLLARMVLLQALWVGCVGYGLGVGLASTIGFAARGTEMAFRMPWQLLVVSGSAVVFICLIAAALSLRTVLKLEPAIVFRS